LKVIFADKIGGHDKQEQIYNETIHNILLECSRRWGKDWILARTGLKRIFQDLADGKGKEEHSWEDELPRLHYWAIGPKYKHADIIRREIVRALRLAGFKKNENYVYNKTDKKLWLTDFDILIEFRSADNPEDLVGDDIAGVIGTEIARWKNDVWFDNVLPAVSSMNGWSLLNTTPRGRNWTDLLYKQCIRYDTRQPIDSKLDIKNIEWVYYHGTYRDQVLIKGFIATVERIKLMMPVEDFKRNFEASRDSFEGQVFSGNKTTNCVKQHTEKKYRWIMGGYDHGHTHRAGLTLTGITDDFQFDVLEVVGESKLQFMSPDKKIRTITSIIADWTKKYSIDCWYCSHERPENIQALRDMFRRMGVSTQARSWMMNSYAKDLGVNVERSKRTARYLFVNRLLFCDKLHYLDSQTELISDFESVRWKELADGTFSSEDVMGENDDVTDALTMSLWSYTPIRRAVNKQLTSIIDFDDDEEITEVA
jgi:hypothetical protein